MTATDLLAECVRRDLRRKQRELAEHVALRLISTNAGLAKQHAAAIRRNEKSIAQLTAKLLCSHEIENRTLRVNGFNKLSFRCMKCKAYELVSPDKLKEKPC